MNRQTFLYAILISFSISCGKSGNPPAKQELTVTPNSITLGGSKGEKATVTLHATMDWTLSISPSVTWLTFNVSEGAAGHHEIQITTSSDNFDAERTATFTIIPMGMNGGSMPSKLEPVTVKQQSKAGSFSVNKSDMLIAGIEQELDSFRISSNIGWTITTTASWLTLGTTTGSNNAKIEIINKADNFSGVELTGTITVTPALSSIPAHVINVKQGPWSRCYGGSSFDEIIASAKATDGSLVLAGNTESMDGDLAANHGLGDILLAKTDANGKKLWQKAFGGSGQDEARSVTVASDGGILVAGVTRSNNGDVSGLKGNDDAWVFKTDVNGNLLWQKTYGGTGWDEGNCILATTDGGFVLTGKAGSTDGDFAGAGNKNLFFLKANSSGVVSWVRLYGGANTEYGTNILNTNDGGYLLAGSVTSIDGDAAGNPNTIGKPWLIKTDDKGILVWQTTINHNRFAIAGGMINSGTGFIVCGKRQMDNTIPGVGMNDENVFVTKLESDGSISWTHVYGGSRIDHATSIIAAHDGNFMIGGYTESNDGDVAGNKGSYDMWLLKIDASGNKLWQQTAGGSRFDQAAGIHLAANNAYWLAGTSSSPGFNTLDNNSYSGVLLKVKE
ncbi:BACON domain-containing protein [Pseudobacter ginsenosidimutans]|uniref:All-beta uncharacterized protein n=1 Tax=Pseudobacter ginsenosidimutans TaxID=661488 RepID=A0A4Q7MTW7_9BACT|nr:BACON domain-containing protein [Pseudobacter ginsenosidimutans]QEC41238.1 BACON domain-containing protein [Pseudobacter ginsenosidimutans]RZS71988.1 all-beta uncharacterized protein [Pseudobacter ginsenosidimutans]